MATSATPATNPSGTRTRRRRRRAVRPPLPPGWLTTDADEVERRRRRAAEETMRVDPLEREHPFFATFLVRSASGEAYHVEIRSLDARTNGCECPDHRVNGLGTCKHVDVVR
jgi:hypothetical protein